MNDELGNRAKGMFEAARRFEDPSANDRIRVRRSLALKIGIGAFAVTAAGKGAEAAVGTAKFSAAKLVIAAVLATAVGSGVGVGVIAARPPRQPSPTQMAPVPPQMRPVVQPLPVAEPAEETAAVPVEPSRPRAKLRERKPVAVAPVSASLLAEETAWLGEARAVLQAGRKMEALARLDAYSQRFPQGVLREEASATRIQILAELGRSDAACQEAQRFLATWPRSPLAANVRVACPLRPTP